MIDFRWLVRLFVCCEKLRRKHKSKVRRSRIDSVSIVAALRELRDFAAYKTRGGQISGKFGVCVSQFQFQLRFQSRLEFRLSQLRDFLAI